VFLPVQVSDPERPEPTPAVARTDPRIEIVLPDGTCVRVDADVDAAALRRVLAALRR
jgi:transposase